MIVNLWQMSMSGAVLVLAVIVFRMLFLHKLPKRTFLILWGIVALRLIVPVWIPSVFGVEAPFVQEPPRCSICFLVSVFLPSRAANNLSTEPSYTLSTSSFVSTCCTSSFEIKAWHTKFGSIRSIASFFIQRLVPKRTSRLCWQNERLI